MTESTDPTSVPAPIMQSANDLLQAAERSSLVKLILAGTDNPRSWLIAQEILPTLNDEAVVKLEFRLIRQQRQSAAIVLLPDGSAFARDVHDVWSALNAAEALEEIQHIGAKFAPGNRWIESFEALLRTPGGETLLLPLDLSRFWENFTGCSPQGFEVGTMDSLEAYGLQAVDKLFQKKGRLGL